MRADSRLSLAVCVPLFAFCMGVGVWLGAPAAAHAIIPKKCCAVPEPGSEGRGLGPGGGGNTQDCDSNCGGGGGDGPGGGVGGPDNGLCWDWRATSGCVQHFVAGFPNHPGFQCSGEPSCVTHWPPEE